MIKYVTLGLCCLLVACATEKQPDLLPQDANIVGRVEIRKMPMPELSQKTPGKPLYGLYIWCDEYAKHRDDVKNAGWKSIRLAGPIKEDVFKMMAEDGMEVMYTQGGKRPKGFKTTGAWVKAFQESLKATLDRYGPGGTFFADNPGVPKNPVRYIEIWNEPNFHYMIADREPREAVMKERVAAYAALLPAAYSYIKKNWPDVAVVGFAAGGASAADQGWIKRVHEASPKVAAAYDVLSTHPYMDPEAPDAWAVRNWEHGGFSLVHGFDKIKGIMTGHGCGDKPVWYTEIGWAVSHADGGHFEMKHRKNPCVSPLLQAAYVVRTYAMAARLGVERVHVMFATDTDRYNAGFFLRDGTWRPSATAFKVMRTLLPNPAVRSVISDGDDGYYAYRMAGGDGTGAVMAWNVMGPKEVTIPVSGTKIGVMDMLGTENTVKAKDGAVKVTVGPYPVYVTTE